MRPHHFVFVSSVTAGGSGRSQRELARRLRQRGHDVVIVADDGEGMTRRRRVAERLLDASVRFDGNPLGRLASSARRLVAGTARAGDIDGIPHRLSIAPELHLPELASADVTIVGSSIARPAWASVLTTAAASSTPCVLYLREDEALQHLPDRRGDATLANSATLAAGAAARGVEAVVVPSVIELTPMATEPTGAVALLVNPVATHGVDRVAVIAERCPDIPIVLQESWPLNGDARQRVDALVADHDNVSFRERRDPGRLFEDARVLLVPHELDNRPRTVLEAQVNGIPAIASDQPGLREQVGDGGVMIAVDADDVAWADTLAALWADDEQRNELAEKATGMARRDDVDPESVTDRFLAAVGVPSRRPAAE